VLRTSVSAVTFVSTYDRTTDNYISATSSSKSTDYHKQASKQDRRWLLLINYQEFISELITFRDRRRWRGNDGYAFRFLSTCCILQNICPPRNWYRNPWELSPLVFAHGIQLQKFAAFLRGPALWGSEWNTFSLL